MTDQSAGLLPVEPPYPPELLEMLRSMTPPGVEPLLLFRVIANNPTFLDAFRRFGGHFLVHGRLAALDREVVIARTTTRCASPYEWGVHAFFFADRVGLTKAQLEATLQVDAAESPLFEPRQRVLIRVVDQLHDTNRIDQDLWRELARTWPPEQLVEIVALVGQYHLVSFLANSLRVQLESYLDAELLAEFSRTASKSETATSHPASPIGPC